MDGVFLKIANISISASWLILVVLVLRLLLKKAPKWVNVLLWGLVGIRLICPFSFESNMSLVPSAETIPQEILQYEGTKLQEPAYLEIVTNPMLSDGVIVELEQTTDRMQIRVVDITFLWIIGMGVFLLYTIISYLRLCHRVSTAVRYKDNIFKSENVASPFVLGIIRPRIYLPFKVGEQELEHVIAHEQAHIYRKDHWWKPLGFLLLTIHWFNPLVWLAYVLLCRDIELACDEKVIKKLDNEQRANYTQALVNCSVNRRMIAACPLAFGEVSVKDRVKSVMNYKKPTFWVILVSVIACVVVAVCFLTNPKEEEKEKQGNEERVEGEELTGDLEQYRTDYIGDAPKVSAIAQGLTYPKDYTYSSIELQTVAEPYELIIYLDGKAEVQEEEFANCASAAFELIGNMGVVTFKEVQNGETIATFAKDKPVKDEVLEAYAALLSGDQSLVNNEGVQWWIPDFRKMGSIEHEYTYIDLDGDGVVELLVQMVNDPVGYNGAFHYENGELFCWHSDAFESGTQGYPLVDGTMVRQFEDNGNTSYTIFRYLSNGKMEDIHYLFAREYVPEYGTEPCPYYTIDGEEVTKEVFDEKVKELITDKVLGREAWIKN